MSSDESQGGTGSELTKKVTGTVANTRVSFLHDVRVEMKQVTWPSREDVVSTTWVVIATVAFFWSVFWRLWTNWCRWAWRMYSSDSAHRGDLKSMGMQWYIIHTYSGFEKKVKEKPGKPRGPRFSLQDKIGRVLIPMEEVVEVRGGKKVVSNRMSYPGYVLVEMDLDENTWHTVRSTPRVTGVCGLCDVAFAAYGSGSGRHHQSRAYAAGTARNRKWFSSATSR